MGAVPVVLDTNVFDVGFDEESGTVAVSTLEEMAAAVSGLLRDPQRLSGLRDRAMKSARVQADWDRYVARVDAALSAPATEHPARGARAVMGDALIEREKAIWAYFHNELGKSRAREDAQGDELSSLKAALSRASAKHEALRKELETERERLLLLQSTRVWRFARAYWRTRTGVRNVLGRGL